MLQPANRLTLIDAMRPPQGFELEAAMAVTYTLDLRALLTAPMAFAISSGGAAGDSEPRNEPVELLHALRSHSRKLTIFSQVGEIALPPSRRVFAFLERAVVPVRAPRGGVVHPKVWVLRYVSPSEEYGAEPERRLRVLVASRNLTFAHSWDTVVRLDETEDESGADLSPVGELFEGLAAAATNTISDEHRQRVSSLCAGLDEARFALPSGVEDLRVHVLGLGRSASASPLPDDQDRSLIISPFLGDDFFTAVHREKVDELISRPESLDSLKAATLNHLDSTFVFDDGSLVELDEGEKKLSERDPGQPLVGLHAKVFAFEKEGRARVFLGSANATGAAFTRNLEILLELVGPSARLGIDRLCGGSSDEPGLRALFSTYTAAGSTKGNDEPPSKIDSARREIANLAIRGLVERSDSGWAVTYKSESALPDPDQASIYCWPLASAGNRRQIKGGEVLDARFETTVETISGFLAFEIGDEEGRLTQFVVPVPLEGVPENRDRLLLKTLIGSAERFLRYLVALLDEVPTRPDPAKEPPIPTPPGEGPDGTTGSAFLPVLEKLLRTMRRDPAKLTGIHPLVSDLAEDDALPEGFFELWAMVYEIAIAEEESA